MHLRRNSSFLVAAALLIQSTTTALAADIWSFAKVADTSTSVPGGSGPFSAFDAPNMAAGEVAFLGYAGPNFTNPGIYTGRAGGPVQLVADLNTTAPGDSSKFASFERPTIDADGNVAFTAFLANGNQGVYVERGNTLQLVADTHTATPGFSGNFSSFQGSGSASVDHGDVAFSAFSMGAGGFNQGIYAQVNGSLQLVADRSSSFPFGNGTTPFIFIDRPMLENGSIIFNASNGSAGGAGIYLMKDGVLTRVIDSTMTLPGTSTLFGLEGSVGRGPIIHGDRTGFFSASEPLADFGFYGTDPQGNLVSLVTYSTIPPGSTVPFSSLDYLALGDKGFTFWGGSSQVPGDLFYESYDGSVFERILGFNDILDGKTVQLIGGTDQYFQDSSLAISVTFTDGSSGVYIATLAAPVPEPTSVILLGVGTMTLSLLIRHRRR